MAATTTITNMDNSIEKFVENLLFYSKLSAEQQKVLVASTVLSSYKKGEMVYSAGDQCPGVIFILEGELRAYMLSEEGKEVTLYRLRAGDVCALSASCMIKAINFDVFIQASADSRVYVVSSSIMKELSEKNVYVENFMLTMIAEKFSEAMWAMQQILFMSMHKRLAVFLYDEYVANDGQSIKLTHEEIAKYIGSAREVVSRMLKYFAGEGIVAISRNEIQVLDKKRLVNLAK